MCFCWTTCPEVHPPESVWNPIIALKANEYYHYVDNVASQRVRLDAARSRPNAVLAKFNAIMLRVRWEWWGHVAKYDTENFLKTMRARLFCQLLDQVVVLGVRGHVRFRKAF